MRTIYRRHLCNVADIPGRDLAGKYPRYFDIVLFGQHETRRCVCVLDRPVPLGEKFLFHSDAYYICGLYTLSSGCRSRRII